MASLGCHLAIAAMNKWAITSLVEKWEAVGIFGGCADSGMATIRGWSLMSLFG